MASPMDFENHPVESHFDQMDSSPSTSQVQQLNDAWEQSLHEEYVNEFMRSILDDKSQKKSLPDGWTETMLQDHITHVLRGNISNNPLTVLDQSKLMSLRSCPSLAAVKKAKLSDDTTPMGEPKSAFAIEEEQTSNFTPERSLFSITPVSSFASKDNVQDVEMTAIEEPDAKMRVES